jgi:hypothetical protein
MFIFFSGLPIISSEAIRGERNKNEMKKNVFALATFAGFFSMNRIGLINKLFLSVVCSQTIIYYYKTLYYQVIIDDLASHMTLTGQEARIQIRFRLPTSENCQLYD